MGSVANQTQTIPSDIIDRFKSTHCIYRVRFTPAHALTYHALCFLAMSGIVQFFLDAAECF